MRKLPRITERSTHRRTDPAYAPTVEIFDSLTHQEIHAKVSLLSPAVLAAGQQAWGDSAAGLADAVAQAHTEIRGAIADGWRGSAATTAADAVRAFEQTGQELADVLAIVSQRLGRAGDAAEALRGAVPEPSGVAPDLAAALLDPNRATGNADTQKAGEHARQDVVRAMEDIYTGVFIPTGNDVPAFPDEAGNDVLGGSPSSKATGAGGTAESLDVKPVSLTTGSGVLPAVIPAFAEQTTPHTARTATNAAASAPADTAHTDGTSAPAQSRVTAAAAEYPLSATTAAARTPHHVPTSNTPAVTTATAQPFVTTTAPGSPTMPTDEQRKRDEHRKDSSGDAATGLGAGAMGGLMGGAMVTGETPRQGASVAASAAVTRIPHRDDDEDDEDFDFDDIPTFLESSAEGSELIGPLDPTTPPVLGEWAEPE